MRSLESPIETRARIGKSQNPPGKTFPMDAGNARIVGLSIALDGHARRSRCQSTTTEFQAFSGPTSRSSCGTTWCKFTKFRPMEVPLRFTAFDKLVPGSHS